MENDKEHAAMGAVIQALSDLDQDGRLRVLEYIAKRFGINIPPQKIQSRNPRLLFTKHLRLRLLLLAQGTFEN